MNHVFLTGFMGAGKSSVGRLVAERLGRRFIDLDTLIVTREGASVPEIFKTRGEAGFRDAEHAALESLVGEEPSVIATGGGVVLRADNQGLLRRHGTVVYLAVTPEEAMARIGDPGDRPLLAGGGLSAARSILAARLGAYAATADLVIDTAGCIEGEVADRVLNALRGPAHRTIRVSGAEGDGGYDIVIGPGVIAEAGARVRAATGASSVALVSDETVRALYGDALRASLEAAGIAAGELIVPAGEATKAWAVAGGLLEQMAAAGLDRSSAVVALGGGVVGDLAGFCAATYMRGIALAHVPTTLLAQVDSAIGGKTAVDLAAGKNLAGAFWPPALVLADTELLSTLPAAEWTNGLVEVAKAALLEGEDSVARLEAAVPALRAGAADAVLDTVTVAAAFKADIVSRDLRETDLRECLNLGHTLGHALELTVGYGVMPHGLAVAEGMRFASALAERLLDAPRSLTMRTAGLLDAVGAGEGAAADVLGPLMSDLNASTLIAAMKGDKKSRAGVVRFVLLEAPGAWRAVGVDDDVLRAELERWIARTR